MDENPYLSSLKISPEPIPNNYVSLRNDCTHKGKIPSREKAREYVAFVFEYITRTVQTIKEAYGDKILSYYNDLKSEKIATKGLEREEVVVFGLATILNLHQNDGADLAERIGSLERNRKEYYSR